MRRFLVSVIAAAALVWAACGDVDGVGRPASSDAAGASSESVPLLDGIPSGSTSRSGEGATSTAGSADTDSQSASSSTSEQGTSATVPTPGGSSPGATTPGVPAPSTADPSTPDPSTPDPSNPDPSNPDPSNPDPSNPDPTDPDPTDPDPTDPDPTDPDPTDPDPTDPDPTDPDPTDPDPTDPDPTDPDPTDPDPTDPDPTEPFDCADILPAANIGVSCIGRPLGFCGAWGECVNNEAGVDPTCRQVCVPQQCEALCVADEVCVGLQDPDTGQPSELEPGVPAGACVDPPSGLQGPYEACLGDFGPCMDDLICGTFPGSDGVGTCTPTCTGPTDPTCPDGEEGFQASCWLGFEGSDEDGCAIRCEPTDPVPCPTGMTCASLGVGSICVR